MYAYYVVNIDDTSQKISQYDLFYIKRKEKNSYYNIQNIPTILRSYNKLYNMNVTEQDIQNIMDYTDGGMYYMSGYHSISESTPINREIDFVYPYLGFDYEASGSIAQFQCPKYGMELIVEKCNRTAWGVDIVRKNYFYGREIEDFYVVEGIPSIVGSVPRIPFRTSYGTTRYGIFDTSYMNKQVLDATIEICGGIGNFKRDGSFELVNIQKMSGLYPDSELYPSETLYPAGTKGYTTPATYQSAWYDDTLSKPYGRITATYKNLNNEEVFGHYEIYEDYADEEYQDYDISDNEIIRSYRFNSEVISSILKTIGNSIRGVQYMPSEITAIGQPWLEAGDTIGVETISGDVLKTIILSRELNGEQILTDFYDSY